MGTKITMNNFLPQFQEEENRLFDEKFPNLVLVKSWSYEECQCGKHECECNEIVKSFLSASHSRLIDKIVESESIGTNNIMHLVKDMENDAEEYDLHNEGCGTDREDECDCENLKMMKELALKYMARVNEKWYKMTEAHRPYCTSEGKVLC